MGFQDYVSEVEAANICSVGSATLRRFAEAGYLNIERDSDGLQLFSRAELVKLFQLDDALLNSTPSFRSQELHSQSFNKQALGLRQQIEVEQFSKSASCTNAHESPEQEPSTPSASSITSTTASASAIILEPESPPKTQAPTVAEPLITLHSVVSPQVETSTQHSSESSAVNNAELLRLQHLVTLYEKLLDYKDGEVKSAREERDYLRKRLEWHEQQSERNQILLLAEAQNTRQLIASQLQRRSVIRHALEWVGLVSPPSAQRALLTTQSIAVATASNAEAQRSAEREPAVK